MNSASSCTCLEFPLAVTGGVSATPMQADAVSMRHLEALTDLDHWPSDWSRQFPPNNSLPAWSLVLGDGDGSEGFLPSGLGADLNLNL